MFSYNTNTRPGPGKASRSSSRIQARRSSSSERHGGPESRCGQALVGIPKAAPRIPAPAREEGRGRGRGRCPPRPAAAAHAAHASAPGLSVPCLLGNPTQCCGDGRKQRKQNRAVGSWACFFHPACSPFRSSRCRFLIQVTWNSRPTLAFKSSILVHVLPSQ